VRGKYAGLRDARRETQWGSLSPAIGLAFIVADFRRDLAWLWGYVIGGVFLVRGLIGCYEHRSESVQR
jgi:hypothetical protein